MPNRSNQAKPRTRDEAQSRVERKGGQIHAYTKRSLNDIKRDMSENAEAYVASLFNPWGVRGVRFPEECPFPSTAGSFVTRLHPPVIEVKSGGVGTGQFMTAVYFGCDYANNGTWFGELASVEKTPYAEGWNILEHPIQAQYAANFLGVRRVSMGIKMVNVANLIARGGTVYLSYTMSRVTNTLLQTLTGAVETEVYDATKLAPEGLEAVYLPVTTRPMNLNGDTISLPACSYVSPGATHASANTIADMALVIWAQANDADSLDFIIEQTDNWEALPFPQVEVMFDRKAVRSAPGAVAACMDAAMPATAVATSKNGFWDSVKDAASNVGKFAVHQLESVAVGALGMLPGLLSDHDYKHHCLAAHAHMLQISPVNLTSSRGLSTTDFLELMSSENLKNAAREAKERPRRN